MVDRTELKALIVELLAEIQSERLSGLTGGKLEFQRASEAVRDADAAMYTSIVSSSAAQAASVSNLAFNRIEAQEVAIERIAQRIDAGDARLIDARQEGTILRDIANDERDANTGQVDELNRIVSALTARIDRLEVRTGFLADKPWARREGERE